MSRSRGWCITVNNWKPKEFSILEGSLYESRPIPYDYLIIGIEVGKKGTKHLQCYIYNSNKLSMEQIKRYMPRAHIEAAKGTPKQNQKYCSKDGVYFEYGELPQQGKRNDLKEVKLLIDKSKDMRLVAQEYFGQYIRYNRGFEKYLSTIQTQRTDMPVVLWFYGATGTGKSRLAFKIGKGSIYSKDHTQWWDGYSQQRVIVVDDFDGRWPFRDLLKACDRYPHQVQYKGGYIHLNSPIIIFTSDRTPQQVYEHSEQHEIDQLMRRITRVVKFPPNELDMYKIKSLVKIDGIQKKKNV